MVFLEGAQSCTSFFCGKPLATAQVVVGCGVRGEVLVVAVQTLSHTIAVAIAKHGGQMMHALVVPSVIDYKVEVTIDRVIVRARCLTLVVFVDVGIEGGRTVITVELVNMLLGKCNSGCERHIVTFGNEQRQNVEFGGTVPCEHFYLTVRLHSLHLLYNICTRLPPEVSI